METGQSDGLIVVLFGGAILFIAYLNLRRSRRRSASGGADAGNNDGDDGGDGGGDGGGGGD